ncbi:MAG: glycosyltransferase family 39 protein [Gemmatimonadetes bacterium]|nr:glycosyltransferase family 39 protein [Gemmatimonadota bacterium]
MTLAVPLVVDERDGRPDATAGPARRTAWWPLALVAVAGLALATGLAIVDELPVGVVADDAFYVILARSIATGQGYHALNLPGHPAGTHFPPGYPALLALLSFVAPPFPASVAVFKALNAVFLAAAAALVARLLRRRLDMGAGWATAVGLVTAVSVPLLILSNLVLSELCFIAFVLALLVALERLVEEPAPMRSAILLGVAIGACALVRTHGVVLVPAAAFVLLARRRWRDALLLTAAAIVTLLPWQLWTARHGGQLPAPLLGMYDSYAAWWLRGLREMGPSMIGQTLRKTTTETSVMLSVLFSPVRTDAGRSATLAALAALALAGAIAMRRRMPVTLLFLAGYMFIVLIWPFQTARFVWAVWPLLLAIVAAGGWAAVVQRGWRIPVRVALAAALVWVAIGYGAYELRGFRGAWWSSLGRANAPRLATTVRWVADHTAPDELVASEYEGAVWLYTGRQALPIIPLTPAQYLRDYSAQENAREGLEPLLAAYPVRTVVVGTGSAYDAAAFLASERPNRLQLRERFAGGAAFTVTTR